MIKSVVAFINEGKYFEKGLSVLVVFEYGFLIVAPVGDMIGRAGVFNEKRSSHDGKLSEVFTKVKQYRPY